MKKIVLCTFLTIAATAVIMNNSDVAQKSSPEFALKSSYAVTFGYDKTMSNRNIRAAIIDSYYRSVASNGKIIRWNKATFPLRVYVQDTDNVPEYYREIVMSAYQSWQRASEDLVKFEFVESPADADIKCYFRNTDGRSIGVHSFTINGNKIADSTIVFKKTDEKNHSLDSKQLYSSALQEIGHALGITGKSTSIYDVMYPIGTKFNTEITTRDLKTLALLYATIPDITNEPLTNEEKANLFTTEELLATLNTNTLDNTKNLSDVTVANNISSHVALAEQYRKRAEYDNAAKEYQAAAQLMNDKKSKSEVYYEVAVMYLDAEEYANAKSCAEIAMATDANDLTDILPPLIDYYTKRSVSAIEQLETILKQNPYNKHAYRLLCQIYRDKHQENMLHTTIKKYGRTAGEED